MIQRIQSIFMLISAICAGLLMKLPFARSETNITNHLLYNNGKLDLTDNIILMALVLLSAFLAFISIFLYRNRKLQVSISYVGILFILGALGAAFWLYWSNTPDSANISLGLGFLMPIMYLVFSLLAVHFIKKDDNLVKSMDRLR